MKNWIIHTKVYLFLKIQMLCFNMNLSKFRHRYLTKKIIIIKNDIRTTYIKFRLYRKGHKRDIVRKIYFRWANIYIIRIKKNTRNKNLKIYEMMQEISEQFNIPLNAVREFVEN